MRNPVFWMKHNTLAKIWCFGEDRRGVFTSMCNGRWGAHDSDFARADDPPHEDRCDACERGRIERRRIVIGLGELADRFDLGGEG
jgi:hypothetical protein